MKKLVCEICGGMDLVKDNGYFICQSCGCKYSIEEAKKLVIDGTVNIQGSVKVDKSEELQKYLSLSLEAYKSANGKSASYYADKALEIDPKNADAWIAKMKSIEFISTLGNLKLMEVMTAGTNAIKYSSEDKKEETTYQVYLYELTRALDLMKLITLKMRETDSIKKTFNQFVRISMLTASQNTLNVDSAAINIFDKAINEAIAMILLVPNEVLCNFSDLVLLVDNCAKQYQLITDALVERFKIYGASLTSESIKLRETKKKGLEEKAENAKEIAVKRSASQKKERIASYWSNHPDVRTALEKEKNDKEASLIKLKQQMNSLLENQTLQNLNKKITSLKAEQDSLGIFNGKKKKSLQDQINSLTYQISETKETLLIKKASLLNEMSPLQKRINEINYELNRDH